jgi:plasmid stability protein
MPTTLTLKNIPDAVYDRLKASAEIHRGSMNSEAIVCLETVLVPTPVSSAERPARVRAVRGVSSTGNTGTTKKLDHRLVDKFKRDHRP